jgi:hypothetical protein
MTRLRLGNDPTNSNSRALVDLVSQWSALVPTIARHNALTHFKQAAAGSKKKYIQTNLHIYVTL